MRIAVSGTHSSGKSTLIAALGDQLPDHTIVAEPYAVLAERGYAFAHPPSVEDFVVQLKQSLLSLRRRSLNRIFDRCPLDFVGYILASPDAERFDLEAWRGPIAHAMKSLDLVVTVPADPVHDPPIAGEDAVYRLAVDDALRDIVDGDALDLCAGVDVLILDGPWEHRVETVLAQLHGRSPRRRLPHGHSA